MPVVVVARRRNAVVGSVDSAGALSDDQARVRRARLVRARDVLALNNLALALLFTWCTPEVPQVRADYHSDSQTWGK